MSSKAKPRCGARNVWGDTCTKKPDHDGRHGNGEYQWPTEQENQAIRDWFAQGR